MLNNSFGRRRLPLALAVVLISTLLSYADSLPLWPPLPIPSSALGWVIPSVAAFWFFLSFQRHVTFPLRIWLPWILWVFLYAVVSEGEHIPQRSVMLLLPLSVGLMASALHPTLPMFTSLRRSMGKVAFAYIVIAGIATGFFANNLQLGGPTGFAAGSMTAVVLASWFATRLAYGDRRALWWWALLAMVPVISLTRMAMLALAVTLPFTLAPLKFRCRLLVLVLAVAVALALFQSERVQAKMFYRGHGTITEAVMGFVASQQGNRDPEVLGAFAQTGRVVMNSALWEGVVRNPWLGYGANASEAVVKQLIGVTHPHNDWLRIWFDYGAVGLLFFGGAVGTQAWHAVRLARRVGGEAAICLYAGASAFLPMALLMLTDNIILYGAFFGNLQFMMLGLGYAAARVPYCRNRDQHTTANRRGDP